MNRARLALLVCCLAAVGCLVATLRGDAPAGSPDLRTALVGSWKLTSMKVNGQQSDLPGSGVTYKHVTPAGFVWLTFRRETGVMYRSAGGTYSLRGDSYTEKIEYGMGDDFDAVKNASHVFTCRIEGDIWHHSGKLANGVSIDEEWVRVNPADAPKQP